jgi:hypothetical protein
VEPRSSTLFRPFPGSRNDIRLEPPALGIPSSADEDLCRWRVVERNTSPQQTSPAPFALRTAGFDRVRAADGP